MGRSFCPHDWHQTTEADLQQMSWGEDYWLYADTPAPRFLSDAALRKANQRPYAIADAAIAQAKSEGLVFHELPEADQSARLDAAEAAIEQAFAALCVKHDLTALDVGMSLRCSEVRRFVSYAHYGPSRCEQGTGNTVSAAIANAIEKVNAKRALAVEVPALVLEAA